MNPKILSSQSGDKYCIRYEVDCGDAVYKAYVNGQNPHSVYVSIVGLDAESDLAKEIETLVLADYWGVADMIRGPEAGRKG